MNYALRVERYELEQDSGGAGQLRGGPGIRVDYRVLGDEPIFCITESEQSDPRFAPPGLDGGGPGAAASLRMIRDGEEVILGSKGDFTVQPGDVVSMRAGGGGGVGDPHGRDRAAVVADVLTGRVSREAARDVYGLQSDELASLPA
jgi:N-methylhydantoinase B